MFTADNLYSTGQDNTHLNRLIQHLIWRCFWFTAWLKPKVQKMWMHFAVGEWKKLFLLYSHLLVVHALGFNPTSWQRVFTQQPRKRAQLKSIGRHFRFWKIWMPRVLLSPIFSPILINCLNARASLQFFFLPCLPFKFYFCFSRPHQGTDSGNDFRIPKIALDNSRFLFNLFSYPHVVPSRFSKRLSFLGTDLTFLFLVSPSFIIFSCI